MDLVNEEPIETSDVEVISVIEKPIETPAVEEPAVEELPEFHFPDAVVKHIATFVAAPGNSLRNLLSMCGVCQQWRSIARRLNAGTCVSFNGLENTFTCNQATMMKIKKLSAAEKEDMFFAAACLFSGYSEVVFAGDGTTEKLLLLVAAKEGRNITHCRIQAPTSISDAALSAFLGAADNLQVLTIEDVGENANKDCNVSGRFLSTLFEKNSQLHTVHFSNIKTLNWSYAKTVVAERNFKSPITKLHLRNVRIDADSLLVLKELSNLKELEVDGYAGTIATAAANCPLLTRISYLVSDRGHLDDALMAMRSMKELRQLEIIIRNFVMHNEQLRMLGMLPSLVELRLDSYVYKQQPTFARNNFSHIDNDGVRSLVDSICSRWSTGGALPLKLSLCGAAALSHEAVSALLRLPILTELEIGGCSKITAMDKMRLVAKVRAGRELLESGRTPTMRRWLISP